jgi:hypothetical protein
MASASVLHCLRGRPWGSASNTGHRRGPLPRLDGPACGLEPPPHPPMRSRSSPAARINASARSTSLSSRAAGSTCTRGPTRRAPAALAGSGLGRGRPRPGGGPATPAGRLRLRRGPGGRRPRGRRGRGRGRSRRGLGRGHWPAGSVDRLTPLRSLHAGRWDRPGHGDHCLARSRPSRHRAR